MSEPKQCPRCKLTNPPNAVRCDCGYDFDARALTGPSRPPAPTDEFLTVSSALFLLLIIAMSGAIGAAVAIPIRMMLTEQRADDGLWGMWVLFGGAIGAAGGLAIGVVIAAVIAYRWERGR